MDLSDWHPVNILWLVQRESRFEIVTEHCFLVPLGQRHPLARVATHLKTLAPASLSCIVDGQELFFIDLDFTDLRVDGRSLGPVGSEPSGVQSRF